VRQTLLHGTSEGFKFNSRDELPFMYWDMLHHTACLQCLTWTRIRVGTHFECRYCLYLRAATPQYLKLIVNEGQELKE
jgi:hypothetical protein